MKLEIIFFFLYLFCQLIWAYPEIDPHSGDKAAGKKSPVFKSNQETGFPHTGVSNKHYLQIKKNRKLTRTNIT